MGNRSSTASTSTSSDYTSTNSTIIEGTTTKSPALMSTLTESNNGTVSNNSPSTSCPMPTAVTNEKGPIRSMASSLPFYKQMSQYYHDFMYEDTIDGLKSCQKIERVLLDCQKSKESKQKTRTIELEETDIGYRITRLMSWIKGTEEQQNQNEQRLLTDGDGRSIEGQREGLIHDESNCQRELHALWLCRAIHIQCSTDVLSLRDCIGSDKIEFLNHKNTYYQNTSTTKTTTTTTTPDTFRENHDDTTNPNEDEHRCAQIQRQIGSCIAHNFTTLDENRSKNKKNVK